jgi:hypothetical protein
MDVNVLRAYPNAQTGEHITDTYLAYLEDEYRSDLKRMLFATSLCSDDVNVSTDFRRVLKRPFTMGGLGGIPFTGYTGMVAFAHHIPDGGDAFIMYGPHIGITEDGQLGKMRRRGQAHETSSCGALQLALARIKDGTQSPFSSEDPVLDYQQLLLEELLSSHREQILMANDPIKEVTDITYTIIHEKILKLVMLAREEFNCERLFALGGIIVNTAPDMSDYVDVKHFEVFHMDDLKEKKPVSILRNENFKRI